MLGYRMLHSELSVSLMALVDDGRSVNDTRSTPVIAQYGRNTDYMFLSTDSFDTIACVLRANRNWDGHLCYLSLTPSSILCHYFRHLVDTITLSFLSRTRNELALPRLPRSKLSEPFSFIQQIRSNDDLPSAITDRRPFMQQRSSCIAVREHEDGALNGRNAERQEVADAVG
jgi:hypothetical protein